MKFKLALLTLVMAVAGFTGCDTPDVRFDANYTADLNINVAPGRDINGTFNESVTIDPASNPDVQTYLNLIKSWEVVGLTGEAMNVSNSFNLVNATFSIVSSDKNASWTFENVPVSEGTTLTLDNSNGQWDTINQILAEKQSFTVSLSGQTDEDDVSFTLRITIQTRVTANPL